MGKTYEPPLAEIAQKRYCREKKLPAFFPAGGKCWVCRKNIFYPYKRADGTVTGISVEEARERLITGCPHCCASFVD